MEHELTPAGEKKKKITAGLETLRRVLASKKTLTILIILLVLGAMFYFKDYLVVATVDGVPISRLRVVQELEKQNGRAALDSIITEKLIESEAKKQNVVISDEAVNQEIVAIEASIQGQGVTLEEALRQQGIDRKSFEKSIKIRKTLSRLLGDKVAVTEEEISKYIEDNKGMLPPGEAAGLREQISDQLENQKLSQEASQFIDGLKVQSQIQYYKQY